MAIKIVFTIQREMFHFLIVDKNIFYTDRKFKSYIRCLPKPENFLNQIRMSRNKIPQLVGSFFSFTKAEEEEYSVAKNEDELADIIEKDARLKGAKLLLRAKVNNEEVADVQFVS